MKKSTHTQPLRNRAVSVGGGNNTFIQQVEIHYKAEYFDPQNPHPGETLLKTLDFCFKTNIHVPEWAQAEYRKCYKKYQNRISDNPLVMAFDTDQEAGKYRAKQQRQMKYMNTVCHTLWHLHINEGMPVDKSLFEEVSKRHHHPKGLSGRTIEEEFYPVIKQFVALFGGFVVCKGFVKPRV